jgi:transcriptional regulator NrdR family protein
VSDVLKFESIEFCDSCGSENVKVYDSRIPAEIRIRHKKCLMCGNRFTTYEIRKEDVEKLLNCDRCKEQLINIGYEVSTIIKQLKVSEKQ